MIAISNPFNSCTFYNVGIETNNKAENKTKDSLSVTTVTFAEIGHSCADNNKSCQIEIDVKNKCANSMLQCNNVKYKFKE